MKIAAQIVGLILLIGAAMFSMDSVYTRQAYSDEIKKDVSTLSSRLDRKITEDRLANLQQRQWRLEDRHGDNCGREKSECRALRQSISKLKRKLQ